MNELRQYLEQMKWMADQMGRPDSFEGYVLREGRPTLSQELTKNETAYVMRVLRRGRFPIKQCYYNSQIILATMDPESRFTYVEGYCVHAVLPVLHGWLEIGGKVVDVTMRSKVCARRRQLPDRVIGTWLDEREYFGVPFDRNYVLSRMIDRQAAGSLIDDLEGGWPLLNHGAARPVVRVSDRGRRSPGNVAQD